MGRAEIMKNNSCHLPRSPLSRISLGRPPVSPVVLPVPWPLKSSVSFKRARRLSQRRPSWDFDALAGLLEAVQSRPGLLVVHSQGSVGPHQPEVWTTANLPLSPSWLRIQVSSSICTRFRSHAFPVLGLSPRLSYLGALELFTLLSSV